MPLTGADPKRLGKKVKQMSKFRVSSLAAILVIALVSVAGLRSRFQDQELTVNIPNASWVRILFETPGLASKSIDEITSDVELSKLRTVKLPKGDIEARIWVGFGVNGVDGLIIRRSAQQWSAIHLHGMAEAPPLPNIKEVLPKPKSGWEGAWQRLTNAGILTLPDASEVDCNTFIQDGKGYVVEINMNRIYRTYMYDNPDHARCENARKMIQIGEILAEEFGLAEFLISN
jgi:hypothetical protein